MTIPDSITCPECGGQATPTTRTRSASQGDRAIFVQRVPGWACAPCNIDWIRSQEIETADRMIKHLLGSGAETAIGRYETLLPLLDD